MGRAANGGSHVPHLQRRQGAYHLRVRVPDRLRVRVGLREVRRSLRVHTFAQARPLALKYAARVMEVFEMAQSQELTRDQVLVLIQRCFDDLAAQMDDGYVPKGERPDVEIDYQSTLFDDHSAEVQDQLSLRRFARPVTSEAHRLMAGLGVDISTLSEVRRTDVHVGVARALLERDRLFHFRLTEGLLPYEAHDPLFHRRTIQSDPIDVTSLIQPPAILGPTIGEALTTYLANGAKQWVAKTHKSRTRALGYLRQHLTEERRIGSITSTDIVEFRKALVRLRVQNHRDRDGSFLSQQTDNEKARISSTTVENLFNATKAFFAWAKGEEGLIADNPAEGVRLVKAKTIKGKKSRRPFSAAELGRLFSAPVFTGVKSVNRRFEAGPLKLRDAYFWLPILGYYTGARLGELVQLHLSDVCLDKEVPYLNITEEGTGEKGSGAEKSVKSLAGVRRVPVHPDLLELGFASFVAKTAKAKKPGDRLFWQISFGADGQASTVFSKWFGRMMDRAGLTDRALVFHSFRHTMEDAFRNAWTPSYVTDRIIGHAGGKTSDGYGEGISLPVAHEAICKAKLPVSLPSLFAGDPH